MNQLTPRIVLPLLVAVCLLAPMLASAQFGPSKIATAKAAVKPSSVGHGGKGVLLVTLSVKPQYHVNANKPGDPAYIPTVFSPQATPGIAFGPVHYPAAKSVKVSYSPKPLLVYTGQVKMTIPFTVMSSAKPGIKRLMGSVSFQGCDAKSCFPPASALVTSALTIK